MKLKHNLIAGAALAVCSLSTFAAGNLNAAACTAAITTPEAALALVANCAPAQTLFIGGASTMSANTLAVLNSELFDTAAMTPIEIANAGAMVPSATGPVLNGNIKAFVGKSKAITGGIAAGTLVYVVYNYNNGSAGGVSQLLGKTPKLADQSNPLKAIPEADVPFVGPAKDVTTPGGTTANTFCTAVSAVKVSCSSHTTLTADLALSDVRAQELYKLYPAAAKGKPATLTQVPLFLQSFGVAVSQPLYVALQKKTFTAGNACVGDFTAACQPSISSADYASLVAKDGKVASLADLTGDASLVGTPLILARRDDLSGTQAASNIFFVNGQCGGNGNLDPKGIDVKVGKAGGLLGGLAIRTDGVDDIVGVLDVQSNVTSGTVKTAVGSATDYAIGVLGTGSGGLQGTAGRFVKIDGVSPNYDGTNFMNAAATRAQIASGRYPFAFTLYGMYVTATLAKSPEKKASVLAVLNGFKNSTLSDLAGIAYLDGSTTVVGAPKQSAYNRQGGNNCSPITKL